MCTNLTLDAQHYIIGMIGKAYLIIEKHSLSPQSLMAYLDTFDPKIWHIIPNVASPCPCTAVLTQVAHSERFVEMENYWSLSWAMKSSLTALGGKLA